MPWNGAGVFTRLYNFVADAAAGIKILATKQDAEWNNLVTGINNVLTLDGQNSPSADIPWGGKKITGLAPGTASTDAATVGQLASGEWTNETLGTSWINATSFKVLAADATATYTAGRRVRSLNTAVLVYSTVLSSTYSAPDTTVVVKSDGATVLDATFANLAYGFSYDVPSYLSPRSAVRAHSTVAQALAINTITKVTLGTEDFDTQGEFALSRFTSKYASSYFMVVGRVWTNWLAAGFDSVFDAFVVKNGVTATPVAWTQHSINAGAESIVEVTALVQLDPTDYVELWCRAQTTGTTAGGLSGGVVTTVLEVVRLV